ncbi:MAG: hypothetical protein IKQ96_09495 [Lachnospiraceae bacterium]|nr:hypothetical protein [Lachnospiraceae bacterium]
MKKRHLMKAAATALTLCLAATAFPAGSVLGREAETPASQEAATPEVTEEKLSFEGHIDTLTLSGGEAYLYVPDDSDLLAVRTCTTPILVVLGHEDFTAESAKETAVSSGIAAIAKKEGSIAAFLNSKGDEWAAADLDQYGELLEQFSDSSNLHYEGGKSDDGKYCGSQQRIYVFAEGTAADFAAEYFSNKVERLIDYGFYQLTSDLTPACTVLFDAKKALPASKEYPYDIPMVIVNPADPGAIYASLAALNPVSGCFAVTNGAFDAQTLERVYDSTVSRVRRQSGRILQIPDYEALGIHEEVLQKDLKKGTITYYQYKPETLDETAEGSVPLVLLFHGGGNHAQYEAWATGWLDIALEDNLMIVSVDRHTDYTSEDMIELLEALLKENSFLDRSRVYASGFSMGAVKCWNLAVKYPEYFAGLLPCDAGYMSERPDAAMTDPVTDELKDVIIPLFYVGGGKSFANEAVGLNEDGTMTNVGVVLQRIFAMNNIDDQYFYDKEKNETWGIQPVSVETLNVPVFEDKMEISSIADKDETVYVKLAFDVNKGHEIYAMDSMEGWKFIRRFSRKADGSIEIAPQATYSIHITADDWGCGVDKAILTIDRELDSLDGYTFHVMEKKTALNWATFSIGTTTAERTVTAVYLCNADGEACEGPSCHVAIEMTINPDEGSPLLYNILNYQLNEWCDPYELKIEMKQADQAVQVSSAYTERHSLADLFEKDSYTAEDGTTFQYASFDPEGNSDTLFVWLHGIGEGGTDPDIALLAAEVVNLAGQEFQKTVGGAHILVPQCPTYWMDSDGHRSNFINNSIEADGTSYYTNSLHEFINSYKKKIGAKKVVVAGCSNGGYMTMLLATNYGTEYDAYIPICEALADEFVTDENIATLAKVPMFFIYAQNDPLVIPAVCEIPTLERLKAASPVDLHIFAPADVHDTTGRFFGEDGKPAQYFGHGSWRYFFNNEAVCDADGVNCWEWIAGHVTD